MADETDPIYDAGGLADPWGGTDINCETQTGSDWYQIMLSASHGGKPIHGTNMAATCETLGKSTEAYAAKVAHGRIRLNPRKSAVEPLSGDFEDTPFAGAPYVGTMSAEHALVAVDEDAWDTSAQTMAKNAAILVAIFESSVGSQEAARFMVEKITGSPINENAANAARIPVNYAKREILTDAKHAHTLFTQTNIQRGVVWHDQQFARTTFSEVACIDWGRVTLIARYLAEVNMRYDPNFRAYAAKYGVPYILVRGAWATAFTSDYALDVSDFHDIPTPPLEKYGVPSLDGLYDTFTEDCVTKALRYAEASEGDTSRTSELLALAMEVKTHRVNKRTTIQVGTEVIQGAVTHSVDAGNVTEILANSTLAPKAVEATVSAIIRGTPEFFKSAQKMAVEEKAQKIDKNELTLLIQRSLTASAIVAAKNLLNRDLMDAERSARLVDGYVRRMVSSSTFFRADGFLSYNQAERAIPMMMPIVRRTAISPGPKFVPLNFVVGTQEAKSREAMYRVLSEAKKHLTAYKATWVARYQSWSDAHAAVDEEMEYAILYGIAASALRHVTGFLLCQAGAGFIDPSSPATSYLGKAAIGYAKKRNLPAPEANTSRFSSAAELASALDVQYPGPVTFCRMEEFARTRLAQLAGDFAAGDPMAHEEIMAAVPSSVLTYGPQDNEDDVSWSTEGSEANAEDYVPDPESEAKWEAMFAQQQADRSEAYTKPTYAAVRGSYETPDIADKFARLNGYPEFLDAYQALGEESRYDPETEFCKNAMFAQARLDLVTAAEQATVLDS